MNYYQRTQNILQHLHVIQDGKPFKKGENQPFKPVASKVLTIFTGSREGLKMGMERLVKIKEKGHKLSIAFSHSALNVLDVEDIKATLHPEKIYREGEVLDDEVMRRDFDKIFVITTTQNTVVKLAMGIQDQFIPSLLWSMLWQKKEVFINTKGILSPRGVTSKQLVLEKMMKDHLQELEKMGVKTIEEDKEPLTHQVKNNEIDSKFDSKKTVITEADIIRCSRENKEMMVPSNAIITPLAYDTAKGRGITIVKK
ncbi:MAG: hypothetical protein JJT76_16695 [Clostridiaceae bacterium]|nr:hypothetical protein [Clostridiaceae bacterium]